MSGAPRPSRIAVVGAADASAEEARLAHAVGRGLAEAGAIVVCGGHGGVMEAAARGASEAGGLTIGILPGREPSGANPWISVPIATGMGEARNALVVRAGEVVIAIGGSWGTLSEIAIARKLGMDVGVLGEPPAQGLDVVRHRTVSEAVGWALRRAEARRMP